MATDAREIFANLVEKEKLKGHHSPEGRAIRTLTRALNGWSSGGLSVLDVLVLCDQSIEDWLKARLKVPAWSVRLLPELLEPALHQKLICDTDAAELNTMHTLRLHTEQARNRPSANEIEGILIFCVRLVERHW